MELVAEGADLGVRSGTNRRKKTQETKRGGQGDKVQRAAVSNRLGRREAPWERRLPGRFTRTAKPFFDGDGKNAIPT